MPFEKGVGDNDRTCSVQTIGERPHTHHFVSRLISSCTYAYGIVIPFCEKPRFKNTAQGNKNTHIVGSLPLRIRDRRRQDEKMSVE